MSWDLPTRLFHWSFAVVITGAFISGKNGFINGHELFGLTALGLLVFRFIWGFVGHQTARFSTLLHSPKIIWAYVLAVLLRRTPHYAGHNPLGGLAVVALLLVTGGMALTGPWNSDDILYEGPMAAIAPELFAQLSPTAGQWHARLHLLLIPLVVLHLLAILAHKLWLKEPLVARMISGKDFAEPISAPINPTRSRYGVVLLIICVSGALALAYLTPSY